MTEYLGYAYQVLLGLIGLSVLVFVHELGHFIVAKRSGVKVKVFSIGFGYKILRYKHGETEYCLSVIPFGGYVAMAGEEVDSANPPQPGDFNVQPVRVRAAIAFGGPASNVIFALAALYTMYLIGVPEPIRDRLVVGSIEAASPGVEAGIRVGDTIFEVAGKPAQGWQKFREEVGTSLGAPVRLRLLRNGDTLSADVVPSEFLDMGVGYSGIHPRHRVIVRIQPEEGSPAAVAGILQGDTIVSVDGHLASSYEDVVDRVSASKGRPVPVVLERDGKEVTAMVSPRFDDGLQRWLMGIQLGLVAQDPRHTVRRGPIEAGVHALETSWEMSTSIFRYLWRMIEGKVKPKALSGPVGIIPIIGLSWLEDPVQFVLMLALISLNLGVMNLLPLAITDGGILAFLLFEAIRGRPVSGKVRIWVQQIATVLIISLFLYITVQDVGRFPLLLK